MGRLRIFCKCGCGQKVTSGSTYVHSHNLRDVEHTPEQIERMLESRKWYKHSSETRRKIGLKSRGRIASKETRIKMSNVRSGSNNGMSSTGRTFYEDSLHKYISRIDLSELFEDVKKRDGYKCFSCHTKKNLRVHHIVPLNVGYESRLCDKESNLITLCVHCHPKIHRMGSGREDHWYEFIPIVLPYLQKFGYKQMLLNKYKNHKGVQ